jgi:hypothetical protein
MNKQLEMCSVNVSPHSNGSVSLIVVDKKLFIKEKF